MAYETVTSSLLATVEVMNSTATGALMSSAAEFSCDAGEHADATIPSSVSTSRPPLSLLVATSSIV